MTIAQILSRWLVNTYGTINAHASVASLVLVERGPHTMPTQEDDRELDGVAGKQKDLHLQRCRGVCAG